MATNQTFTLIAGILFIITFFIEIVGTLMLILIDPEIVGLTTTYGSLIVSLAVGIIVLAGLLLFHWTLVFGIFCFRWKAFPDEHKNTLITFGAIGITLCAILCFLLGGVVDWVGGTIGTTASILVLIAGIQSEDM